MTREHWADIYAALWIAAAIGFVWIGAAWSRPPRTRRNRQHGPRR